MITLQPLYALLAQDNNQPSLCVFHTGKVLWQLPRENDSLNPVVFSCLATRCLSTIVLPRDDAERNYVIKGTTNY